MFRVKLEVIEMVGDKKVKVELNKNGVIKEFTRVIRKDYTGAEYIVIDGTEYTFTTFKI